MSVSMAPSWISRAGMCGRKSFPTKKQRKMKSSMHRSRSKGMPGAAMRMPPNSTARYSRSVWMRRSWRGLGPLAPEVSSSSSPSAAAVPSSAACFLRSSLGLSTTSRRIMNRGSCVASASMIRSASRPWTTCHWCGSYPGRDRWVRMWAMILCSPSPGTEASETTTARSFQPGCAARRLAAYARSAAARRSMKAVPGVITLESNLKLPAGRGGGGARPRPFQSARRRASSASVSAPSLAALNRRLRCWFILARGAGPSTAM
mmetsp:Transcript_26297/g.88095  ORF Transcript_26297/g.88095 Transcript_26297/m.88095 type:complete len:261 (-) Transcript_26297:313-1095(-)